MWLIIPFNVASLTLRYDCTSTTWWRHQMETFSASLALCAGNSHVPGEFPAQRPVTRSFDVFFDLHLYKRLSKQPWGWWFETPSWSLWRHCNECSYPEIYGWTHEYMHNCWDMIPRYHTEYRRGYFGPTYWREWINALAWSSCSHQGYGMTCVLNQYSNETLKWIDKL